MKIDNSLLDNYETSLADISLQERQFGYRSKSERFDIEPTTSNVGRTEMADKIWAQVKKILNKF